MIAAREISIDLRLELGRIHPHFSVHRNPSDGVSAESKQVGGFLQPRVRFGRRIHQQSLLAGQTLPAHVPRGLRRPSREDTDEVRHVAAAHQETAAPGGIPDELGNPPHRLRFDFGREWSEAKCADVLVDHRRQKIAERSERGGTRRDVAEKTRMAVDERMLEEQARRVAEHGVRGLAVVWKRAIARERPPDVLRRFTARHEPLRHRGQPVGERIDQGVAK